MRKKRYSDYHLENGCPVEFAIEKMGGKWKGILIFHLLQGTKRFSELRKISPKLTQKMLTKQLRELEMDHLVHREVFPVVPPHVEYSLTKEGQSLAPIISALQLWGEQQISK